MSQPHLDDEALSAALDGEAVDAERAHLDDCPACSDRLGRLRAVAQAVSAPVPPAPAGAREAAVARALGAAGDDLVIDLGRARATRRPALRWASLGAVAALVLALLVAVPLLSGRDDHGDQVAFEDRAGKALDSGPPPVADDLGDVDGDEQLRAAVTRRLGGRDETATGGAELRQAAPSAEAQPGGAPSIAGGTADARSCFGALGTEVPEGDVVAFQAPLRWKGTPALALVYRSGARTTVYVLAQDDCRILTFQRIASPTP